MSSLFSFAGNRMQDETKMLILCTHLLVSETLTIFRKYFSYKVISPGSVGDMFDLSMFS